jgi:hypothetical protein
VTCGPQVPVASRHRCRGDAARRGSAHGPGTYGAACPRTAPIEFARGFDCPPLDPLFLAAPVANKGNLLQYAGRILRPYDGKATAEVHDYHDELTGVLASSLA